MRWWLCIIVVRHRHGLIQPSRNEAVTHRENKVRMIKPYGQTAYGLMQHEMQRRMRVDEAAEVMQGEKMHEEKRREEDTNEGNDR